MNRAHARLVSCFLIAIGLVLGGHAAHAQPATVHRLGFLSPASSSSFAVRLEALRHGLRDLGYREGQNLAIEYRWAEGKDERLAIPQSLLLRASHVIE